MNKKLKQKIEIISTGQKETVGKLTAVFTGMDEIQPTVEKKFHSMEGNFTIVDDKFVVIGNTFGERFQSMEEKFSVVDDKFLELEDKFIVRIE